MFPETGPLDPARFEVFIGSVAPDPTPISSRCAGHLYHSLGWVANKAEQC